MELLVQEYGTVDADSMIAFFYRIRELRSTSFAIMDAQIKIRRLKSTSKRQRLKYTICHPTHLI
jgi:Leu/Phe-tRNA-protein transferase